MRDRAASRVMRVMIDDAEQRERKRRPVLYAILGTMGVVAILGATSDHRTMSDVINDCEGGQVFRVALGAGYSDVECVKP